MTFGTYIQTRRTSRGLTQKDAAAAISMSAQYLNDLERDRRKPPSDAVINRMAHTYDTAPAMLHVAAGRLPPWLRNLDPDEIGYITSLLHPHATHELRFVRDDIAELADILLMSEPRDIDNELRSFIRSLDFIQRRARCERGYLPRSNQP